MSTEKRKTFVDRVFEARAAKDTILCLGLDPQIKLIPPHILLAAVKEFGPTPQACAYAITKFFRTLIPALAEYCCVAKPQSAFYESYGSAGIGALEEVEKIARDEGLEIILDAKRGDGGDTADSYADGYIGEVAFPTEDGSIIQKQGPVRVDAITVLPSIGEACVKHFLDRVRAHGTGVFVVTKSSFIPNSWVEQLRLKTDASVWEAIAQWVQDLGGGTEGESGYRNFGVVCGATMPQEAIRMREILPNAFFLVPGYGAQGAPSDHAVIGFRKDGFGGVVNSSRKILYAYRDEGIDGEAYIEAAVRAARTARDDLNAALDRACKRPA